MPYYLRTSEVYDIEEETGHSIEDFLDADCFSDEEREAHEEEEREEREELEREEREAEEDE